MQFVRTNDGDLIKASSTSAESTPLSTKAAGCHRHGRHAGDGETLELARDYCLASLARALDPDAGRRGE